MCNESYDFYMEVDNAKDQYAIEWIVSQIRKEDPNNPTCSFNVNNIPEGIPPTEHYAYLVRKAAFELRLCNQTYWQKYWFRCCISDKCDFIFKSLKSKDIDREDDIKDICSLENALFTKLDEATQQSYIDFAVSYLLKRYNLLNSWNMWNNSPKKNHAALIQIMLPRLMASILVGSLVIATSNEISDFTKNNDSLWFYSICLFILSSLYLLYECLKVTQATINYHEALKRIFRVLTIGVIYSVVFSVMLTKIGMFQFNTFNATNAIPETFYLYKYPMMPWACTVIFYAMFSLFIGIIAQLLWEEKTVSEPF